MFQITLRAARELCGYSVSEVAELTGIPESEIEMIEKNSEKNSGNISIMLLMKLIRLYGIPADYIFFGIEEDCFRTNRAAASKRLKEGGAA